MPGAVGTCSNASAGTICGAASCTGTTFTPSAACDGAGTCQAPTAHSCAPFICGTNSCKTTCASDADCAAGTHCLSGSCS
ncbi:MAG TPA: hypothetical protein VMT03_25090 [Polyangia bacterium]|nr:hypothetical protein [Polyangia bacterium]